MGAVHTVLLVPAICWSQRHCICWCGPPPVASQLLCPRECRCGALILYACLSGMYSGLCMDCLYGWGVSSVESFVLVGAGYTITGARPQRCFSCSQSWLMPAPWPCRVLLPSVAGSDRSKRAFVVASVEVWVVALDVGLVRAVEVRASGASPQHSEAIRVLYPCVHLHF